MKKIYALVCALTLIFTLLCGCTKGSTEDPSEPTAPPPPVDSSLIVRDCDLFVISLPEELVEETPGRFFADREASVGVQISLQSKDYYPEMSLQDFAQYICNTLQAEQLPVLSDTEFGTPSFSFKAYGYFLDNYMNTGMLSVFYETDESFIMVSIGCLQSEFDARMADFKEWINSIQIYNEPSGSVYNSGQEQAWEYFDLTLHLDNSFTAIEDSSDQLSLTNHLGDWIYVCRYEKNISGQTKNLWQYYEDVSTFLNEVEVLSNGTIRYTQTFTSDIDFGSSELILESERYWYYVRFAAPEDEFDSRIAQFEQWQSAIELRATTVISTPKKSASATTELLHKNLFGTEPAEISQVYDNGQIAISIAKMAEGKCAVYAAAKNPGWQAMQIFNYETIVLSSDGIYLGSAYEIGDYTAVFILGTSTEVSDTLGSVPIDLPDCNARLLVLPNDLPSGYCLNIAEHPVFLIISGE